MRQKRASEQEKIKGDGPPKDWKLTNEIVNVIINFTIATKRLKDRKEQDHNEERARKEMMSKRGRPMFSKRTV